MGAFLTLLAPASTCRVWVTIPRSHFDVGLGVGKVWEPKKTMLGPQNAADHQGLSWLTWADPVPLLQNL